MRSMKRTYTDLIHIPTYKERFEYCDLCGLVGDETFGCDRWLNQVLYSSPEWRRFRRDIIIRDKGCDLAFDGFEIPCFATIHHLNPITKHDILERRPCVFDPENVILVATDTHKFIHYGHGEAPNRLPVERRPNDTCPWR